VEPTVRRASPDDVDFLTWVMVEAATSHLSRCVWDSLLGTTPEQTATVLREVAGSASPHWCHRDRFLVAEVDGGAVAAIASYDPASEANDALTEPVVSALLALGYGEEELGAVITRAEVLDACTPRPRDFAWGIENVAVLPEHRGRALVEALFEAAYQEARADDRDLVQIMCLDGNDRAERAWRRQGFELRAHHQDVQFEELFGCPGLKLLARPV
jgi:ribosomal protein S18 acetylase RimI-like enzyme